MARELRQYTDRPLERPAMNKSLHALVLLLALVSCTCVRAADHATPPKSSASCLAPAKWYALDRAAPREIAESQLVADMASRDVVLLGEQHDDRDHHLWQLQTLAALHAARPAMVIGFEAFPRRSQPVLDRWVAGELDTASFLREVEWETVWAMPAELYLPLFHFARINRIPMVALNVDKALTGAIGGKGYDAVPVAQREGVSRPAAAPAAYEQSLFDIYKEHAQARAGGKAPDRKDAAFRHFVDAQTTWDRAMAEALAARVKQPAEKRPLAVGIMGAGHVRGGYGVVHQLRALGVTRVGALLPVDSDTECSEMKTGYADAVYALPPAPREALPPPRLGVRLELRDNAVTIAGIEKGSLAERSGLNVGDVIVSVAGTPAASIARVTGAIRSAPAGFWLPIQVRRGTSTLEVVVKFAPAA
jgi:uncharacterized iron-regulated protein